MLAGPVFFSQEDPFFSVSGPVFFSQRTRFFQSEDPFFRVPHVKTGHITTLEDPFLSIRKSRLNCVVRPRLSCRVSGLVYLSSCFFPIFYVQEEKKLTRNQSLTLFKTGSTSSSSFLLTLTKRLRFMVQFLRTFFFVDWVAKSLEKTQLS